MPVTDMQRNRELLPKGMPHNDDMCDTIVGGDATCHAACEPHDHFSSQSFSSHSSTCHFPSKRLYHSTCVIFRRPLCLSVQFSHICSQLWRFHYFFYFLCFRNDISKSLGLAENAAIIHLVACLPFLPMYPLQLFSSLATPYDSSLVFSPSQQFF